MFGSHFGKREVVGLMIEHPIAKLSYSKVKRRIIHQYGHVIFKFFGYPLAVSSRQRARVIMKYLDPKHGERVLDAGCGIGYYSFKLATKFGCKVDGVDIDIDDIEMAKKISGVTRVISVNFKICDISELDFSDNTFDKIILSEILEHVRDEKKILNELHRVLKPRGHLIVSTPYVDVVKEYSEQKPKLSSKKAQRDIGGGHVRNGYSLKLLSKVLDDAGFDVVAYRFIGKKFTIRAGFPLFLLAYPISMLDKFIGGVGNGIVLKAEKR